MFKTIHLLPVFQRVTKRLCPALCVMMVFVFGTIALAEESTHWEMNLKEHGIEISSAGIAGYLRKLQPDKRDREQANRLVGLLGSKSFEEREQAMLELIRLPAVPEEVRVAAKEATDPEARWRAEYVCEKAAAGNSRILYAVFSVVADRKIDGLVPDLLATIPLCEKQHLREMAMRAIITTAKPADNAVLEKSLESKEEHIRIAAVSAIKWTKADYDEKLKPLLNDVDEGVRLSAARATANLGERSCLVVLARLLSSKQSQIRYISDATLRELTGHSNNVNPGNSKEAEKATAYWIDWIEKNGQTVKLNIPLRSRGTRNGSLNGNTLLAYGHRNKVEEIDPDGRIIWSYETQNAWSAEKLINGNVLIAAYGPGKILEIDADGKTVWEFPCKTCLNARPLPNGNILAAAHTDNKIFEVTRGKEIVWEYKTTGLSCDAHRLDNGNTLLSEDGFVREVDREGTTVWQFASPHPYGIEPLPNGNILVSDITNNFVKEVTRDKKVVWEYKANRPGDAFRLPNGNTLITDADKFIEITPEKKIVWSRDGCRYGTARR